MMITHSLLGVDGGFVSSSTKYGFSASCASCFCCSCWSGQGSDSRHLLRNSTSWEKVGLSQALWNQQLKRIEYLHEKLHHTKTYSPYCMIITQTQTLNNTHVSSTEDWRFKPVPTGDILKDIGIVHARVRSTTKTKHLPAGHTICPLRNRTTSKTMIELTANNNDLPHQTSHSRCYPRGSQEASTSLVVYSCALVDSTEWHTHLEKSQNLPPSPTTGHSP